MCESCRRCKQLAVSWYWTELRQVITEKGRDTATCMERWTKTDDSRLAWSLFRPQFSSCRSTDHRSSQIFLSKLSLGPEFAVSRKPSSLLGWLWKGGRKLSTACLAVGDMIQDSTPTSVSALQGFLGVEKHSHTVTILLGISWCMTKVAKVQQAVSPECSVGWM